MQILVQFEGSLRVMDYGNFFVLARSLKQIDIDDLGYNEDRVKYLNWLKKIGRDFDHINSHSEVSNNIIENVNFS